VVSILKEALANLPPPFANLERLKSSFASKGLNVKDLVVLSGAHTIGTSHCPVFSNRIYNFTAKEDVDPSLDKSYAQQLKRKCKPGESGNKIVEMDPGSFRTFDNNYYVNLKKRRGLFGSDAALLTDPTTMALVNSAAIDSTTTGWFFFEFARLMEKMGTISVLTENDGQIRRH
jgi:peroxidase